jgi:hypothetical protein
MIFEGQGHVADPTLVAAALETFFQSTWRVVSPT